MITVECGASMARILILWNQIDDDVYEHYRRDGRRAPDWDPTLEIEPWETVEDEMRQLPSGEVTSERVGRAVLEGLRELDVIAAVRFASVYKGFDDLSDFERELTLLTKRTAPKRH